MPLDPANQTQVAAADPAGSTWLTANAGSGKTSVLTNRVARLLLAGASPARILCLTYTKAAATEMQNRLFGTLGEWAMMPDAALRTALAGLGADLPEGAGAGQSRDAEGLASARRLFAAAIETPGGLKIQTIHAFCAGLLRRFPLEAGVSPGFVEADDRTMRKLRAEIVEDLADHGAPASFARLARKVAVTDLDALTEAIVGAADGFGTPLDQAGALRLFGQPPTLDKAALHQIAFDGSETALLAQIVPLLFAGSVRDAEAAAALAPLAGRQSGLGVGDLSVLERVFLFGAKAADPFSAKLKDFPTKDTRAALGGHLQPLQALMQRVANARPARIALAAAEQTEALHTFAQTFLTEYADRKAARGWLDFDDLIRGARRLLSDSPMAQWVLYRLDGGIDHILVDEAQDTSPGQWQVIDRLAQEMVAGEGARTNGRTVFVVGDKKQSIYSFQGADLAAFDAMQAHFRARLSDAPEPLRELTLRHSFRSSPAILRAVDATFEPLAAMGLGGDVAHLAYFEDRPGRVDLWPALSPSPNEAPAEWTDPVDRPPPRSPVLVLAEALAQQISGLIESGAQIPTAKGPRPLHAGDFLVLVQRRGPLFHAIIRACKVAGIDVAGADRLRLGAEIAVRDLRALLSFLATPDDQLALAVVLRSALFGWDEEALFRLAQPRPAEQGLWQTLQEAAARGDTRAEAAAEVLHDLRDRSDFVRPYEVLERVLTRHEGRLRLVARLGAEAEDGIDQLLAQALAYERLSIPDLTGFLAWLEGGDAEVRRQPDSAGRKLRVMTVHGAKGLQAPVVILPDTTDPLPRDRASIITLPGGAAVWKMPSEAQPPSVQATMSDRAQRSAQERLRLLYVAMTRAESWLVVAAAGKVTAPDAWHGLIDAGLRAAGAQNHSFLTGAGLRLSHGVWPSVAEDARTEPFPQPVQAPSGLPAWARQRPAASAPSGLRWIRPSLLGGAKVVAPLTNGTWDPDGPSEAMAQGTVLHRLIEVALPQPAARWEELAAALVPDPTHRAIALGQLRACMADPVIAAALMPAPPAEAMSEVALTAPHDAGQILGAVDRLIIAPGAITAIDLKTNRDVPTGPHTVPEGIMRQMGAYRAALAAIWTDRPVQCAILWTAAPCLMALPDPLLETAFVRATLDAAKGTS